jgi:hypothetical protein
MTPCKYLDYDESRYTSCEIKEIESLPGVRYWLRPAYDANNHRHCQFCKKYGRIPSILDCYEPGFKDCYKPFHPLDYIKALNYDTK